MKQNRKAALILTLAFVGFGLTGITKHFITAPTGFVSMLRGFGCCCSLFLLTLILRKRISFPSIRKHLIVLLLSGACLAINWIVLFEAYELIGVGLSTILDYLAPVIVFFLSPLLFKESINLRKILMALAALAGVVLVSGAASGLIKLNGDRFVLGIVLGLAAAGTYAAFIIFNKKLSDMAPFDKGMTQMAVVGVVLIPYAILKEGPAIVSYDWNTGNILYLLFFVLIQTGFAYSCYFYAIGLVEAQKSSLMSYIDPVVTLFTAFLFLHEKMDLLQAVGAVLILAGAVLIDVNFGALRKQRE